MKLARVLVAVLALVTALVVSCSSQPLQPSQGPQETSQLAGALDIAGLQRRARFAFRPVGDAFVGGDATYWSSVERDGSFRFSPRTAGEGGRRRAAEPRISLVTRAFGRARGDVAPPPAVRVDRDGSASITRGAIVERLRGEPRGIEQTWEIPERPAGEGDLVVRVRVDTTAALVQTRDGVRFESNGRAVTYGGVRWVDGRGSSTKLDVRLDARLDARELVIAVPASVVDAAAYPAVLDPTIAAESEFDAPVVGTAGFYWDSARMTAGKNGTFLLTWMDDRVPSLDSGAFRGDGQVFAARIAANGTILDPTGIVVAGERAFDLSRVRAAFDGQNWLVAWHEDDLAGPCTRILAARVSEAGSVLDPAGLVISCAYIEDLDVAYDGASFVVTWPSDSITLPAGRAQLAKRVSSAGVVTPQLPVTITEGLTAFPGESTSAFACDGTAYCLFVHQGGAGLRAVRVAKAGGAVGGEFVISNTGTDTRPEVTWNGTSFIVAWVDGAATKAAVVDAATPTVGAPVAIAAAPFEALASLGGQTLLAWVDPGTKQVRGVRMSNAGAVLDVTPRSLTASANAVSTAAQRVALGASTTQYAVAWPDTRSSLYGNALYTARLDATATSLDGDGKLVRYAAQGQSFVALGGDSTGYLAAWTSTGKGDYSSRIEGFRISGTGAKLDTTPLSIGAQGSMPSVGKGSNGYLVAWSTSNESAIPYGASLLAATVSTAGVVSAPITIATGAPTTNYRHPQVIFDGTNYHVIYGAYATETVRVQRVTPQGVVLDAVPVVLGDEMIGYGGRVGAATDGTNILAVWTSLDAASNWKVVGRRFTKDLQLLDPAPFTIVANKYSHTFMATAGFDGKQYLVAWEDYRYSDYVNPDLYVSRVTTAGTVLDPNGKLIAGGLAWQGWPAVIGMGDGFSALVAWTEARRTDRVQDLGIYGAFMRTSDGAVLDPGGIKLADLDGDEAFPTFAPGAPGTVLLGYHRDDMTAGVGASRARARFVSSGTLLGQPCTSDDQCVSRACSDGFCCDTPCKGTCQSCSKTPGTCSAVVSAEDADTCGGARTCDATSTCLAKPGQSCTQDQECTTGVCSSGLCCDRACNGACETCASPAGTCTLRPPRSNGGPTCAPFACDGASASCPTRCESNAACPTGTRCNPLTGTCIEGGYCIDDKTVGGTGPDPVGCEPFTCGSGACRTTCRDVRDCVYPAICDQGGRCVIETPVSAALLSGCAAAPSTPSSRDAFWGFGFALAVLATRRRR